MIGVDPYPLTMRELDLMYREKMRTQWLQTAVIASEVHNVFIPKEKDRTVPNDLIPECFRYKSKRSRREEPDYYLSHRDLFAAWTGKKEE